MTDKMRTLMQVIKGGFVALSLLFLASMQAPLVSSYEQDVALPPPSLEGKRSLESCIKGRRTVRHFLPRPLTLKQIGQLCWAAQGITERRRGFRAAPSAGALYPIELVLAVGINGVKGLKEGVYIYRPRFHSLRMLKRGDIRQRLARAAWGQGWIADAPVCFVITAAYNRTTVKYGKRGIRYVHIEAGHVGQNIFLQVEGIGLRAGIVGAFHDSGVRRVLGLEEMVPLLIMPVGYGRE